MISYAGRRRLTRHRTIGARTFPDGAAAPTDAARPPASPDAPAITLRDAPRRAARDEGG